VILAGGFLATSHSPCDREGIVKSFVYRVIGLIFIFSLVLPNAATAQQFAVQGQTLSAQPASLRVYSTFEKLNLENAIRSPDGSVHVIVEFSEPPVGAYLKDIGAFTIQGNALTGRSRLDFDSPAGREYASRLENRQARLLERMSSIAPSLVVDRRFTDAFNGAALRVSPEKAAEILKMEGVKAVYPDQLRYVELDTSLELIRAGEMWAQLGGRSQAGKGVFVALVDTGVRPEHPMFSGEGFDLPSGFPKGYCVTKPNDPAFLCNNKLVAARYYQPTFSVHPDEVFYPLDIDGHGTHTAGIAVGNQVTVPAGDLVPQDTPISGVAPGAYLMVYKALFHTSDGGGMGSDSMLLSALNDAMVDGADIINNSWGGGVGSQPGGSPYQTSIKTLTEAGILVVFSAGNSGPHNGTIVCPGCVEEALTVAASTTKRVISNVFDVTGPGSVPQDLTSLAAIPGDGPQIETVISGKIAYSGDIHPGNDEGCQAFPHGSFAGRIALIQRGHCAFWTKVFNAANAGAVGVAIFNNLGGPPTIMRGLEGTSIPAVALSRVDGERIRDFTRQNPEASGRINSMPAIATNTSWEDQMAGFSSVGPNGDREVLKPDITAPGVNILSAFSPALPGSRDFAFLQGTSMAAPHVAGAAALLKQKRPAWTPQQIKTALTSTSVQTLVKPDGVTPADPFNMGAGRLDLGRAGRAALTFDKPSFASGSCLLVCNWTNSMKNVSDGEVRWRASVHSKDDVEMWVEPAVIDLAPGKEAEFTVHADVRRLEIDRWHFGEVVWTAETGAHPDAHLPLAVLVAGSTSTVNLLNTANTATVLPGGVINYEILLINTFPETTVFMLRDPVPQFTQFIPGTETNGLKYDPAGNELVAEIELAGVDLSIIPALSPHGYFPLATVGDAVPLCNYFEECDESLVNVILDTPFIYLGQEYHEVALVSNGYLIPGGGSLTDISAINQSFPDETSPNNILAALWTDLDLRGTSPNDTGGGDWLAAVLSDGKNEYLVVEWAEAEQFRYATTQYTFQAWIQLGTDKIWFVYASLPIDINNFGVTIGAEDVLGSVGNNYFYIPHSLVGGAQGTNPDPKTPLSIDVVTSGQTFNFAVNAINPPECFTMFAELNTHCVITNVVEVTNSQNSRVFTAWSSTLLDYFTLALPLINRSH
jgi:minor extracellular serine protease Vpr